jgi:cytochrome P450
MTPSVTEASLEREVAAYAALETWALADRWRIYMRLRQEAPVFAVGNSLLVSRYDDICDVLLDHDRVRNGAPSRGVPSDVLERLTRHERAMLDDIVNWEERWLTSANGVRHADLRSLGTRVFAPRAIREMRDRIQEIVNEMLSRMAPRSTVEFISGFAYQLPLTVISEILDIPVEMRQPLHETWRGMMPARTGLAWRTQLPLGLESAHAHFMSMKRQVKSLLDFRDGAQTTEIMTNLLAARADGADEDDILVLIQILVSAGHQTTEDLLGNGVHALLTHPEQWDRLCEDPGLAPAAVEEILRYSSPSQDIERFADSQFTLRGVPVDPDQHLTLLLGSANRDSSVFRDPETFDITRDDAKAHVAFGRGPHFCLGAALSRMEGAIALEWLARRFPNLRLVDDTPRWIPSTHLLGLEALHLALGPDRGV